MGPAIVSIYHPRSGCRADWRESVPVTPFPLRREVTIQRLGQEQPRKDGE